MTFILPKLPYGRDELEPHMSRETIDYHYGKHHRKYVDEANKLAAGTEFEDMTLEDAVRRSSGTLSNNVAQVWNHDFFWNCLTPEYAAPGKDLTDALSRHFDSVSNFKQQFTSMATATFGSGWTWLVLTQDGTMKITRTQNADNPMSLGERPLLTCDVWEHAYYIDYRNDRAKYLKRFWNLVNWRFVASRLAEQQAGLRSRESGRTSAFGDRAA